MKIYDDVLVRQSHQSVFRFFTLTSANMTGEGRPPRGPQSNLKLRSRDGVQGRDTSRH